MKKIALILAFGMGTILMNAQIDANSLMGLPTGTTADMTGMTGMSAGQCMFNTDDNSVWWYDGSVWARATDDQTAGEVNLVTPVDSDGDSANETTVENVVQAITPITSKAGRVFYPPSIAIDASTNGTFSVNLYSEYTSQYANAGIVKNPSAPNTIPVYAANELDYYVTYYDPAVFDNITINDSGLMNYEIIGQPADYNSLINVVFVVK